MYAAIRHYHFAAKDGPEIDRRIREAFVPLLKKSRGFVRYYWLDTGKGEGTSISVFADQEGADASVDIAAEFSRTHMAGLVKQKPEVIEGPVRAHD